MERERREAKRFANLMGVVTGCSTEEHLAPEEDEDNPEQIAADQKKLAAALQRFASVNG